MMVNYFEVNFVQNSACSLGWYFKKKTCLNPPKIWDVLFCFLLQDFKPEGLFFPNCFVLASAVV